MQKSLLQLCLLLLVLPACYRGDPKTLEDPISKQQASHPKPRALLFNDGAQVVWPARGRVSSEFGPRGRRPHRGIDISGKRGSPIFAVEAGQVSFAGRQRGYGRLVKIQHKGYETRYAHCQQVLVKHGQNVRQGQVIAKMGATGNATGVHLHFEWRPQAGQAKDPRQLLSRARFWPEERLKVAGLD